MTRKTCIVISPSQHRLAEGLLDVLDAAGLDVKAWCDPACPDLGDDDIANSAPDILISFLSDRIIRGRALDLPNVNFHPATPAYPGRGGASRAIYDGAPSYGATAHRMAAKVDSGTIYAVGRFAIQPRDTCATLFYEAENRCLSLARRVLPDLTVSTIPWSGEAWSRKRLEEWMETDPSADDFDRKVKALAHPTKPGPFIRAGGHRFGWVR